MQSIARFARVSCFLLLSTWFVQAQSPNDAFSAAWTLSGSVVATNGSNATATKETGEPNHGGNQGGRSVWFSWTAPKSGQIRIDTIGSSFNTLLAVYTGTAVNGLTLVAGNNDGPGIAPWSQVDFTATAGTTYRIAVDVNRFFGTPGGGDYLLTLQTLASVNITSPINNAVIYFGLPIAFNVDAEVASPPVTRVDFYRNGALIGSDASFPFGMTSSDAPLGTNTFVAVAVDGIGLSWTSSVVRAPVLNLGVTITAPLTGAIYQNTNPLTVSVVASLPSGSITNVDFYYDDLKFNQDGTSPFSVTWNPVVSGVHYLTAVGTDNSGLAYTSSPVVVSIPNILVTTGSVWKYLDNGTDQGTNWRNRGFDDSAWASGAGELGYGDSNETTVVSFGSDATNKHITTYFRRSFTLSNATNFTNVLVNIRRDDGAVVYLNGIEVQRFNMPFGAISNQTRGLMAADDGNGYYSASGPGSLLVDGVNVVAVEVHQDAPDGDDLSFDLQLQGSFFSRNQRPSSILTSPAPGAIFTAPPSITLNANSSDADGTVAKVDFYVDDVLLGTDTAPPYSLVWNNPSYGWHVIRVIATDNVGTGTGSTPTEILVYDPTGAPLSRITRPPNGLTVEGPTNMLVTADAAALAGVANVQLLVNGVLIGNDNSAPYTFNWNAPFGSNVLESVTVDANGRRGTSSVVQVTIAIPPTNTVAPFIQTRVPGVGASVTTLSSIRVTFSERVTGVDASDLLVNGVPATVVTNSGNLYVFTVAQPIHGTVTVSWVPDHGIQDFGYPSSLAFNSEDGSWTFNLVDRTAPTIVSVTPTPGAVLTNLSQVTVNFSESITGIEAGDLLINGAPAFGMNNNGFAYTFNFSQPASGPVSFTWAVGHGITDFSSPPNAFNATGAGATWGYTLDARTVLVQSNAAWLLLKGTTEASSPVDAWRAPGFNELGWQSAPAPFYFGDPYGSVANPGTVLNDMLGGYTSIYLRRQFALENIGSVTNLFLSAQSDDGFIAWINGVEVARSATMPAGEVPYNGTTVGSVNEPNQNGAAYATYSLPNPGAYLVEGQNVIAVHAFNQSLTQSSDFGFNAQLFTFLADPGVVAPRVTSVSPPPGNVFFLTNLTVRFIEAVTGVNPSDLLVNGVPATAVSGGTSNATYVFTFAQPAFGPVSVTWAGGHGIVDFDAPPKPFDGSISFQYSLLNPSTPTVIAQTPLAGTTINHLTQLNVTFSEPVAGVDASDLLINGVAASGLSGSGANYVFTFLQPAYGPIAISWAAGHGITDLEIPATPFDVTRQGSTWSYTLVDQTPPSIASLNPPAGSLVTNITSARVTFSESVSGVTAGDLLINGVPATGAVAGPGPLAYTFSFAQPNATVVNFSWANNHGIRDLAPLPNSFDPSAPGSTWSYTTLDNLAPAVGAVNPPVGSTVRSLTQITVTFTETVVGVGTNDLLVNGRAATQVSGTGAGPYVFNYLPPSNGVVEVRWVAGHGISDLAQPPNPFPGGQWSYTLDPNATFAGKVLVNELMFNPASGQTAEEWIELRNVSGTPINLAGWRFTRGVDFTFPSVTIPPAGFLVVAANVATFQARNPNVSPVVGGWSGSLANSDETLELVTTQDEVVNSVHYASQGDWARRERGNGSARIESITRNGSTATVTIFGHGFTGNDQILISGAEQPEYNGTFSISGAANSTFNYPIGGTPESPATGYMIARQVVDDGATGWSWFNAADGFGNSLELINAALPNDAGQNWSSSAGIGGTPGQPNSVAAADIAPLVFDVTHFPVVPRSSETVTITARVRDELPNGVTGVTLFYRDHTFPGAGTFVSTNMFDDGAHGDGQSGDKIYGVRLPAAANGTVIEFYVRAVDGGGLTRTWPAPTWNVDGTFGQLANALYQVDDEIIANTMPVMRIVMTGTERASFPYSDRDTDAESNVTLISQDGDGTKVRYLGGVRIRGAGSRGQTPPNNRLNIPNDNRWNGFSAVNLNAMYVHAQITGAAMARKAGLPASSARIIQYRINGVNPAPLTQPGSGGGGAGYGSFVMVEPVNGDLADNLFPEDGNGNVYRASTGNHSAQLLYQGTNANSYLAAGYFKTSNQSENDWTDMFNLTFAFTQTNAPLLDYVQGISTNVNVEFWMRYFAVGTLMSYTETSMFNGRGDDYALYRGLKDPRFVAIGHDFDTVFGQGDTTDAYATRTNSSIFVMLNPPNTGGGGFGGNPPNIGVLRRFMTNEFFAPVFFAELKRLTETVFTPAEISSTFDQMLSGWGNGPTLNTINAMKNHAINRRANVIAQIPLTLTVTNNLPITSGYAFTTTPSVTLFGSSHAIDTRKVLVNGFEAARSPWEARWTNNVTLRPGINRVLVQSLNSNDVEFARATIDIWFDDGTLESVSGNLNADTVWTAAAGPYQITSALTVGSGTTLTIQPGTTVYLSAGASLTVANGGRLIAEGTDIARIRFARVPGAGNWGSIVVNGSTGSPETRIAYAHIEGNNSAAVRALGGTLFLDHVSFGNTAVRYLDLDAASFVVQDSYFPSSTAAFEPIHGSSGVRADGRALFLRNFVGRTLGYNDSIDFTGGNRPGPIIQVIDNVFTGSDDDILDFDSTDAWVEGNVFMHVHRNGSPDSASAISGGADNADTSQITAIGNIFYDVDQAANAKQGNFYTFINNTIVSQNRVGSQDLESGVITMADEGTALGLGFYLEGNIILQAESLVRTQGVAQVTFTNNLIHELEGTPWSGPGGNNFDADPLLRYVPQLAETTNFNSFEAAQVMWQWFSLQPGSPAAGIGPNGRDLGAVASSHAGPVRGISIAGEPIGSTAQNSAVLTVGVNRTGNGIPAAGFPNGSGYTQYRWRLDGGAWSADVPPTTPITLNGLSAGPHMVEVVGRNDAGFYQDAAVFGASAVVSVSRTWTVSPGTSPLRLNEILAANSGVFTHVSTTPDVIELYNQSDSPVNLAGVRLTDDPQSPDKFIFPAGASIPARGYLAVFANLPDGTPGYHTGFSLGQAGEGIYLFDAAARGGALIDSVVFGMQLTDLSIGRLSDGTWALNRPTIGGVNRAATVGDPRTLRINEWLAIGAAPFNSDYIELYNASGVPVALGGLYFTDELVGELDRHQVPPLSFIAAFGYQTFVADGDEDAGADHLNFSLNGDFGEIGLFTANLALIDCVYYQAQRLNVSQGRSPNGSGNLVFFETPTPGAPNPLVTSTPQGGALVINEVLASNAGLVENGRTPDWVELYNGTAQPVHLGGMGLTDNTQQPRRFVFPNGLMLLPAGYLRVLCDQGSTSAGPGAILNTNFALGARGGGVYLFDTMTNGGSLLNSVIYGLQVPDLTIGRVPDGSTNWVLNTPTPGTPNNAVLTLGNITNLKVNEWLADPVPGEDDWIEIYNPNSLPVALGGMYLSDDLIGRTDDYRIPPLSFLGVGTNGFHQFTADDIGFSLRGAGESIGLSDPAGVLINGVDFGQQTAGVSEGRFPDGAATIVAFPGTGSPGESNWRQLTTVAINEVLTHSDEPLEDAIELRNLTSSPIDVGGWWLSDDNGTLRKYQIPSPTVLPANGFTVIYEAGFTNPEVATIPFAISSEGDEVVLSASANGSLTGYRTRVDFGAQLNGVSFGRYVTSDNRAELVAMSARSFGVDDPGSLEEFRSGTGLMNPYPRVGPVIISEIMYHPPDLGTNENTRDEFIELRNITTAPVPLYDPAHPTNTWRLRDAVDYNFPPGTSLAPGETLLVVSFDPVNNPTVLAEFKTRYNLGSGTVIMGPYAGKLANDTDDVELRRPDAPDVDEVPYVLVERVRYADLAPWPAEADGTGFSLHRVGDTEFGNDPVNWIANAPSPGPVASTLDSDGDGMTDDWERSYSLDPLNPLDAGLDSDGDGLTNLQEFEMGSNPRDSRSGVHITSIALSVNNGNVVLTFTAFAGQSYTVESAPTVAGPWTPFQDIAAVGATQAMQLTVPATGSAKFFRLRTPWRFTEAPTLRIETIQRQAGSQIKLTFTAPPNLACAIEHRATLTPGVWNTVTNFPAGASRAIEVTLPASANTGFYRLRSP